MSAQSDYAVGSDRPPDLIQSLKPYEQPDLKRAVWQLLNTLVPYAALWVLMVYTVQTGTSYWITLALSALAAGFLVRIFIIFHDCGHGSFFASRRANAILGAITGVLTFTPYEAWRHSHALHHTTVGDLDRRGFGDVWTMTVNEYRSAPWSKRVAYRVFRAPYVMLGIGSGLSFLVFQRIPAKGDRKQDRLSVLITDVAILTVLVLAWRIIGLRAYVLVQLPIILIGAAAGVWLFYVQHQFEGVYWSRHENWAPLRAALEGSSFYKLPAVLQWFAGNIGFHHIHHIRPRIPNYRLPEAFRDVPAVRAVQPLTLAKSLKSLRLRLYDETQRRMVSFRALRRST